MYSPAQNVRPCQCRGSPEFTFPPTLAVEQDKRGDYRLMVPPCVTIYIVHCNKTDVILSLNWRVTLLAHIFGFPPALGASITRAVQNGTYTPSEKSNAVLKPFFFNVYLGERERAQACTCARPSGGGAERQGDTASEAGSRLSSTPG